MAQVTAWDLSPRPAVLILRAWVPLPLPPVHRKSVASSIPRALGGNRSLSGRVPKPLDAAALIHRKALPHPASASQRQGVPGGGGGEGREGPGRTPLFPAPPPHPRGLGKGSILRRGAPSIRPRDANEGERVPTARTLCGTAHLLLRERPLCPRQFTGNSACANGPAPLCGPPGHWPPSVGTAAAPGPQAPARRRAYIGPAGPPPATPRSPAASLRQAWPPAPWPWSCSAPKRKTE